MNPQSSARLSARRAVALSVVYLMAASAVGGLVAPASAATTAAYAPIKWLLIQDGTVGNYGDKVGYHQFWLNFMRDLGTPFDVVNDTAVNYNTFWNSAGEPKYQAFVYAGVDCIAVGPPRPVCTDLHREPSSGALGSMKSAVYGGISGIFIASAIQGIQNLWGISTLGELGSDQKVNWDVVSSFEGVNGTVFPAGFNTTSYNAVGQLVTSGWSGNGSMLIRASWPGGSSAVAASVQYGAGTAYFWSGTEGRPSPYREGYQSAFSMATGDLSAGGVSNYKVAQQLRESLFRYVYDAWRYRVQILPWETGGSAVIFGLGGGNIGQVYNASFPWSATWNLNTLAAAGLSADIGVPLQGGSLSALDDCPLSEKDVGSAFPPYTAKGYRFFCSWNEGGFTNHAMVFSRLDNLTQAVDNGSVRVAGGANQTFDMADGNSTLMRQLKVKITAAPGSYYQVRLLNPSGSVAWASGTLTANYSSPTWVTFRPNATFAQGNGLKVQIRVTSGSVSWAVSTPGTYPGGSLSSSPSSDADFVVVGGTYWDIVVMDRNHDLNWTDDGETTQPGLLTAGGTPYPSENQTFQFQGFPPQESFKRFAVDWVSGRTTTNGPPKQLTLVWYSTEGDWTNTVAGRATRDFYLNYTENFGFGLVLMGRFDHPYQGTTSRGSDYSWNANSSYYSYGSVLAREASLVAEANAVFGPDFNTLVQTAPYSGATYPPVAIYDPAHGQGAFWGAGQRIAWLGDDQTPSSSLWRNVVVGGFRQYMPRSPYDGVSQLDWSHTYTFVGTNYQDMQLLRGDFAGAEVKSDLSVNNLLSYYDLYPARYKQPYDLNSTAFLGTTENLFSFWNSTMSMLEGMPAAYYQGGNLTLEFNARSNVPGPVDDLVWRLPGQSPFGDGLTLRSVVSNVTGWSVANQTSEYVHLEAAHATGRTKIVASYGVGPTQVRVGSSPPGLAGAFAVDGTACPLSPCTYQWAVGSVHNVTAANVVSGGAGTRYAWSSWPSGGTRSLLVTAYYLPESLSANFRTQYLLSITSPCSTFGRGWFDSGAVAEASSAGVCRRSGGEGVRISAIDLNGAPNVSVETKGNSSVAVSMNGPQNVTFASVTQFSVSLNPSASLGLSSITPSTLPGDGDWYDGGTAVTVILRGIYGRGEGEGLRLSGYSVNGGNSTAVATSGNVTVARQLRIESPVFISATLATDYNVSVAPSPPTSGTAALLTPPTVPNDPGWYDSGTAVVLRATPKAGYTFQDWRGNVVLPSGQESPYLNVVVSEPIRVTADFAGIPAVQTTTASRQPVQSSEAPGILLLLGAAILVALSAYALYLYKRKEGEAVSDERPSIVLQFEGVGSG